MQIDLKILAALGLTASLPSCISSHKKTDERPNIIYIMSDDHAYHAISAYGGPLASLAPTPNIDRIAKAGMRFNHCLVTNSISGPCRAVVLTGKYSHLNGFIRNEGQAPFDSSQLTFPKLLRRAGYTTAIIGKWHLESTPSGFDHWDILPGQGVYYNPDFIDAGGRHRENGYVTELITEKSLAWLKKAKESGKPFMLMMHHKAPHREWDPGPNELGMYGKTRFPEPPSLFDDYSGRGAAEHTQDMSIEKTMRLQEDLKLFKSHADLRKIALDRMDSAQAMKWNSVYDPIIKEFYDNPPAGKDLVRYKYQRYLQDYLACIAGVDKSVGAVLDYLKENGLDKNTIVIYASDQGFYLGEHGWFDKRWIFEESLRTPLLIEWPGVTKPGSVNNNMVSNLDLAETFLDMAGLRVPDEMQGRSIVPVLNGQTPPDWRKEFYYHYYEYPGSHMVKMHYGIVSDRYKLVHFYNDIDEWELFDLNNDPQELRNVYRKAEYAPVDSMLHRKLNEIIKKYSDFEMLKFSSHP
jgi:arylsulfatase A-like enzyme